MNQQSFVQKWRKITAAEKKSEVQLYQEHLIDLCQLAGHPTPLEIDPGRTFFTVEEGVEKEDGGYGRADVWYKDHFAIEYKKPGGDLDKAYKQLLQYRESLQNPPLLIVCDFHRMVIHTNFTYTAKQEIRLSLDGLLTNEGLRTIRNLFFNVEALRPGITPEQVTEEAAARFGNLAAHLGRWGHDPQTVAHFLIRLLFCLFAEDIDLLPANLFSRLVAEGKRDPKAFNGKIKALFDAMASGAYFGEHNIAWFNGGLFNDAPTVELDADALLILGEIARLDWSAIEPAILGTLFTRSLDPQQRARLGAQYTSKDDILLIVEPVLMAPLRREWDLLQSRLRELAERRAEATTKAAQSTLARQMTGLLGDFAAKVRRMRVLDPASGSGNFLYIALRQLLDLEKEVSRFAGEMSLQPFFPEVSPEQLYGIEVNDYAHELAQATVWIGYLQWLHENGHGFPTQPVLKALDNIKHMDAILAYDAEGKPVEPEWPAADVIVGNPPFLGDKRMLAELKPHYVSQLRSLYNDRLPGTSDLVTYWFEKARAMISQGKLKRAGLLATNSIKLGFNQVVLRRIQDTGQIFWAVSNKDWLLDGAALDISMIGFDDGSETDIVLDGQRVQRINADLTATTDLTSAQGLAENVQICFLGMMKAGPFDIPATYAQQLLAAPINTNGRPNSDVVRKRLGGQEITGRPLNSWIIDFGVATPLESAMQYELPIQYIEKVVKPIRDSNRRDRLREKWWLFGETRPGLRKALRNLDRCIVTPEVSKHRIFAWMDTSIVPDHTLHVIARDDDYFFGVLQSRLHMLWSLRVGSTLEDRPRYSSSRTFETYPFPWPPGQEPQDDPRVQAIAEAARELVALRDAWLNPPDVFGAELNKRTLTNLYNARPDWLDAAHKRLDAAVLAAYGWPEGLADEEILGRLLALNLQRAQG